MELRKKKRVKTKYWTMTAAPKVKGLGGAKQFYRADLIGGELKIFSNRWGQQPW